jgi:VanZ family protein
MLKRLGSHWKSIAWALFILVLCGIPGNEINKVKFIDIPQFDKVVHFILYFVFTLLLISESNKQRQNRKVTVESILIAAVFALSYGVLIEVLQKYLFINRSAEILDVVANTFGYLIAVISYKSVNRITKGYI